MSAVGVALPSMVQAFNRLLDRSGAAGAQLSGILAPKSLTQSRKEERAAEKNSMKGLSLRLFRFSAPLR